MLVYWRFFGFYNNAKIMFMFICCVIVINLQAKWYYIGYKKRIKKRLPWFGYKVKCTLIAGNPTNIIKSASYFCSKITYN